MRKVIAFEWMSLDGVVQAPGDPDEDRDGGFRHGGWHLPYFDDTSRAWVVENMTAAGGFLFGRRTYENLSSYWPNASEDEQVIARPLNSKPKYVASTTLEEPLEWRNSSLLSGRAPAAVRALKEEDGDDLLLIGSPDFAQTLIRNDLIDEYRLMIDPIVLGSGKPLFQDADELQRLRLVESEPTSTGAILATYAAER